MIIKKLEKPKERPRVWVEHFQNCVRNWHDGKEWGEWETIYEGSLGPNFAIKEGVIQGSNAESVQVDPDVLESKIAYAVFVTYSSGNTFGRSEGETKIAEIVSSAEKAEEFKKQILKGTYKGYCPWNGYFENLNNASIELLTLKE